MKTLLFALSAVMPIIIIVALGYFLKRLGIINPSVAKSLNKIVFKLLLPVLLFMNIYSISDIGQISLGYIAYAAGAVIVVFLLSIPLTRLFTERRDRRAPLIQSTYRSNCALIGTPLALSLAMQEGVAAVTLLTAVTIPLFNILAVTALSIYGSGKEKTSVKRVLLEIIKNPLIIGVAIGLLCLGIRQIFGSHDISFRLSDITPVYRALEYLADAATPLALLALGAGFEFSSIKGMKKEIIFGTLARAFVVPLLCIGTAYLCFPQFTGAHFAAFVAVFCTPLAVSAVPMAQEMGADEELAGQLVVWTTVAGGVSVFLFTVALRALSVF